MIVAALIGAGALLSGCSKQALSKTAESWCRSAPNCDVQDMRTGEKDDAHW